MRAAICVPWRAGVATRDALWRDKVQPHLEGLGLPIYAADSDAGRPFNRSQARNRAAALAGDVDVLLFNDADTIVEHAAIRQAIDTAATYESFVVPYQDVHHIDPDGTVIREYHGEGVTWMTGTAVFPRAIFDRVGGWDERYVRYGFEDMSMACVLQAFYGAPIYTRGVARQYNHERTGEEVPEHWASQPAPDLAVRYRVAWDDPVAIMDILSEPGGPLSTAR